MSTPADGETRHEPVARIDPTFPARNLGAGGPAPPTRPPTAEEHLTPSGQALSAPRDPPPPQLPGFEVLRELGRGGRGVVYLARQPHLNRVVALKMILAGAHADPQDVIRFLGEAEAVARLRHPNIVQLYEAGRHNG